MAVVTNCSIVGSTNCFLARSCLVCTLFCYITLRSVTQRHKLNLKLVAYLKSAHQELLNEVLHVQVEQQLNNYQTLYNILIAGSIE